MASSVTLFVWAYVCVCVSPNCLAKRQCCCGSSCDIKCVIDVNLAPQLSPSPTEAAGAAPLLTSPNVCWSSCFIFIPITSCSQQKTHTRTHTYTNRSKVGWLARTLSWFVETTVNLCFEFAASLRPARRWLTLLMCVIVGGWLMLLLLLFLLLLLLVLCVRASTYI